MITDLFVVPSGLSRVDWGAVVPPGCRRGIEAAPPARIDGEEAVLEFPPFRPRSPARHLVPSLSLLGDGGASVRFEMSVRASGAWSAWVGAAVLGPDAFEPLATETDVLRSEVDVFRASVPVEEARLRLRLRAGDPGTLLASPWLVTLSTCDLVMPIADGPPPARSASLEVPALSQMTEAPAIRRRICSPTSVAMVLEYWGARVEVGALAAEIFHPALDLYGVWPAAVQAAARRGIAGYLLRFPDWAAGAWCLEQGLPIVASVRYGPGELAGAAMPATDGHLLVLTGHAGPDVLVNDPAADGVDGVRRRYPLADLRRVWLERAGVGYVLFRPRSG